jgi:hypothetical protein
MEKLHGELFQITHWVCTTGVESGVGTVIGGLLTVCHTCTVTNSYKRKKTQIPKRY